MATTSRDVFIASAARTPIGSYLGALGARSAPELGATSIRAALERAKLAPGDVEEVFMGNVLSAGIGQAPARQASLKAKVPDTVPTTTVSKVCGSGLQAIVFGTKTIMLGDADIVVAGGMESMSNVPYYLMKARTGYRMGDDKVIDGMIFDGLWDPYGNFHMGVAGEMCAREYGLTREAQDEFARESYRRAVAAQKEGLFAQEIAQVEIPQRKGNPVLVAQDEEPGRGDPEKFG
jgi:acetyl-CoA C-acetyltransferase